MPTSSQAEPFISDFTVAELLLIGDSGWEPIALVSGDCSYDLGNQVTFRKDNQKLTRNSEGLARGQALALERMREAAVTAGGTGVVGVRFGTVDLELTSDPNGHPTHHFSAVGTAVRRRDGPEQPPRLFTSQLSGQDTWALTTAGCSPLGVVFGFGVYHVRTTFRRPDRCCEMPDLTGAIYDARGLAMHGMQTQASDLGASGVVGVSIELKITPGPTVTFVATGTAVRTPLGGVLSPDPQIVIQLND